jgi:hypothetical protein
MTLCDAGGNWLESVIVPANIGERAGALLSFEKVQAAWWSGQLSLDLGGRRLWRRGL